MPRIFRWKIIEEARKTKRDIFFPSKSDGQANCIDSRSFGGGGGPRSPSTKVVLKFRVGAEGGSVKGGPFYRGQTENALFIGRSRLAIHRIPAKSERVEAEGCVGGVTQAAGMKLTGGEGGVKWHLFPSPFAHSHAYTRVYIYIRIPRLERNDSFDRFLVNFFPSSG